VPPFVGGGGGAPPPPPPFFFFGGGRPGGDTQSADLLSNINYPIRLAWRAEACFRADTASKALRFGGQCRAIFDPLIQTYEIHTVRYMWCDASEYS